MPYETDYEETWLREQLVRLQREYQKAAQPYVDRLVLLESMKPPTFTLMTIDEFDRAVHADCGTAHITRFDYTPE